MSPAETLLVLLVGVPALVGATAALGLALARVAARAGDREHDAGLAELSRVLDRADATRRRELRHQAILLRLARAERRRRRTERSL